jgi:hypothetical protein
MLAAALCIQVAGMKQKRKKMRSIKQLIRRSFNPTACFSFPRTIQKPEYTLPLSHFVYDHLGFFL